VTVIFHMDSRNVRAILFKTLRSAENICFFNILPSSLTNLSKSEILSSAVGSGSSIYNLKKGGSAFRCFISIPRSETSRISGFLPLSFSMLPSICDSMGTSTTRLLSGLDLQARR